jgi:hypothetical protein
MNLQNYLVLQCARPQCQDDNDPEVAAALVATQANPQDGAWLQSQREQDALWGYALRAIEPPKQLRAKLGVKTPTLLPRRSFLRWTAVAGVVTAGASALLWRWRQPHLSLSDLVDEVAGISARGIQLSLMSMEKAAVAAWLDGRSLPRAKALPEKLDAVSRKGCHVYQIQGQTVSLECFIIPEGMRELHLFSIISDALDEAPEELTRPVITTHRTGQTVATWSKSGTTHVLSSKESLSEVAALFG